MIEKIVNAMTGEVTEVESHDVEIFIAPQEPTEADRLDALEDTMLFII